MRSLRHITLWIGVAGAVVLATFLDDDFGPSRVNTWKFVVLPLAIAGAWTFAVIAWARTAAPEHFGWLRPVVLVLLALGCAFLLFVVGMFLLLSPGADC